MSAACQGSTQTTSPSYTAEDWCDFYKNVALKSRYLPIKCTYHYRIEQEIAGIDP